MGRSRRDDGVSKGGGSYHGRERDRDRDRRDRSRSRSPRHHRGRHHRSRSRSRSRRRDDSRDRYYRDNDRHYRERDTGRYHREDSRRRRNRSRSRSRDDRNEYDSRRGRSRSRSRDYRNRHDSRHYHSRSWSHHGRRTRHASPSRDGGDRTIVTSRQREDHSPVSRSQDSAIHNKSTTFYTGSDESGDISLAMRNSATGGGWGTFDMDRLHILCDAIRKSVRTKQVDIEWHEPVDIPKSGSVGPAKKRLNKFGPSNFAGLEAPPLIPEEDAMEGGTTEVPEPRRSTPPPPRSG